MATRLRRRRHGGDRVLGSKGGVVRHGAEERREEKMLGFQRGAKKEGEGDAPMAMVWGVWRKRKVV
jgi:hypothetical protein